MITDGLLLDTVTGLLVAIRGEIVLLMQKAGQLCAIRQGALT